MDNLGKIGRSLMDNWGKLGSHKYSILWLSTIGDPRTEPKPILVWGTVNSIGK